ncbi:SDR family NAD(P)-dependent oxidoreductase [Acidovorax sp. SUPP3334]|uniref:SDR family NAD(P)-dependent oxidoreductase n=1 Tax=Acidovorax sp. SUPP3334 TaxID=2920881 RepID=UPI0024E13450|nr:SDR family NAD(P)-dependent oxidoreductase [Acidovorax sp. SUPP3334]
MLRLDIDDDESIQHFTEALFAQTQQLDVLLNNAGYMVTGLAEETSVDVGREQFETNFWGTVKVTNALLPHFHRQKHGQIITVSSIVGLIGPPNLSYHTASKHAVQGFFKSLRFELAPFNIKVSMVEPSWFKTHLAHNAVSATTGRIADYNAYRKQADAATQKGIDEAEAPDAVIQTITHLIGNKEPRFSNPVGKMTGMILLSRGPRTASDSPALQRRHQPASVSLAGATCICRGIATPFLTLNTSAITLTAISAGVLLPMNRPIGPLRRASSSSVRSSCEMRSAV